MPTIPLPLFSNSESTPPVVNTQFLHQFDATLGSIPVSPDQTGLRTMSTENNPVIENVTPLDGNYLNTSDNNNSLDMSVTDFSEDLSLSSNQDFCLEGFVNWNNLNTVTGFGDFIAWDVISVVNSDNHGMRFYPNSSTNTGEIRIFLRDDDNGLQQATGTFKPTDGVWYHIAVIRQGNQIRSFFDGVPDATLTLASSTLSYGNSPMQCLAGCGSGGVGGGEPFPAWANNKLDSVRYYVGGTVYNFAGFTPPTPPLGII